MLPGIGQRFDETALGLQDNVSQVRVFIGYLLAKRWRKLAHHAVIIKRDDIVFQRLHVARMRIGVKKSELKYLLINELCQAVGKLYRIDLMFAQGAGIVDRIRLLLISDAGSSLPATRFAIFYQVTFDGMQLHHHPNDQRQ